MKTIEKKQFAKIFGGKAVPTKSTQTIEGQCGSTCTTTTTDSFDDKNNDGVWGAGESGTSTSTTVCN